MTAGQVHEATVAEQLLDMLSIRGKPGRARKRFEAVLGDKEYDSERIRRAVRNRSGRPLIARRKDRRGKYSRVAEEFDRKSYRKRNAVERLIGRLKEWRRIATRYDKPAESFKSFILLGFIRIWLKDLLSHTAW